MSRRYAQIKREFQEAVHERRVDELPCTSDPDAWFADPGTKRSLKAQEACMQCPLLQQCREYALKAGVPNGVWGGMDEKARETVWKLSPTGKPTHFIEEMDAAILPLLQERRDHENFDAQHTDNDEDVYTQEEAA